MIKQMALHQTLPENLHQIREQTENFLLQHSAADKAVLDRCDIEVTTIDATIYGSDNSALDIHMIKPKRRLYWNTKAIIYLHGGNMCMLRAEHAQTIAAGIALAADCIVFMVDFRNAPETKAPSFILECYAGTKYVIKHAHLLSINKNRICIYGENSGGYLAAGVAMELAKRNEGHLIKVVIPDMPMVNSHWLGLESADSDLNEITLWYKP